MKFGGVIHHNDFNKAVLNAVQTEINRINSRIDSIENYINLMHQEITTLKVKLLNHIENEEFKFKLGKNEK